MVGLARKTKTRTPAERIPRRSLDLNETVAPERRRSPWRWILGATVLVAISVAVTLTTADNLSKSTGTVKLTGPAKIFKLDDVRDGAEPVRLLDYAGTPVVLNFFGSWCPPCLREMPDLQAVSERYRGKVAVIGVTFQDTRPEALDVLRRAGVTYPAGWDPDSEVGVAYALSKMPTTVFISKDGTLLERAEKELSEQQLDSIIERLFFPGG